MKSDQDLPRQRLKDVLGYCLWLVFLLARLLLAVACWLLLTWIEDQGGILVAILTLAVLFIWVRFVWTRVLRRRLQELQEGTLKKR